MIFLSDEDTDIRGLVSAWLNKLPSESAREVLPDYIDKYFFKAIEWCQKHNEFVVDMSLVGCVLNGLSHMHGVSNRLEFAVALIRCTIKNKKEMSFKTFGDNDSMELP